MCLASAGGWAGRGHRRARRYHCIFSLVDDLVLQLELTSLLRLNCLSLRHKNCRHQTLSLLIITVFGPANHSKHPLERAPPAPGFARTALRHIT